ncbi:endonuclease/exonuclease/phosphatase family protein [Dermabacteraceae bacterium TAE3-ERU27]|nr:endonuclease/exonuclease/phosphatase family protein [Dermabacteraceae bacterium TAE3-ERU27]
MSLRALSYNIHAGIGLDKRYDLSRIAEVIAASGADVVGLQEVEDSYREATNFDDQPRLLAEMLDMHVLYAPGIVRPGSGGRRERRFGNALLSRTPFTDTRTVTFRPDPTVSADETRVLLLAETVISGQRVTLGCTHFDHVEPLQRLSQARQLAAEVKQVSGPLVVMGDLNSIPKNPEVRTLVGAGLVDTGAASSDKYGQKGSFPVRTPLFRIDYIFAREMSVAGYRVIRSEASDHRPISADLILRTP